MTIIENIKKISDEIGGNLSAKSEVITVETLIAERKSFLSKKKLTYIFKVRISEDNKQVKFTEMLKESGFGLTGGGGFDSDMSTGIGFKKETYKTFGGAREGTIEESSELFGKTYKYKFDYAKIRKRIEKIASDAEYMFDYKVLPIGV